MRRRSADVASLTGNEGRIGYDGIWENAIKGKSGRRLQWLPQGPVAGADLVHVEIGRAWPTKHRVNNGGSAGQTQSSPPSNVRVATTTRNALGARNRCG